MKTKNYLTSLALLLVCSGSFYSSASFAAEFCSDDYYINVTMSNGARWDMCWEERNREGIVLHKIHYTPKAGQRRLILNSANLAQIHVPYDDNGARYHDISDYGLGGNYMVDLRQADCPGGKLLDFADSAVVCQQVSRDQQGFRYQSERVQAESLSLFSVSRVGAYHYIPLWRFFEDGAIEPAVGATGALQRFNNASAEDNGWLIADDKVGLGHLHNFFWKLDFDLAGTSKDDLVQEINLQEQGDRSSVQVTNMTTEAGRSVNPATARRWLITDGEQKNAKGLPLAYEIRLPQSDHQDIGPDSETFTREDIYFTTYKDCELYASHNPIIDGCADSLAGFINRESLQGKDLVVWPSTTFYHMPRAEDAPFMDAHWSYISLTPRGWSARNPLSTSADLSGTDLAQEPQPEPPVVTPPVTPPITPPINPTPSNPSTPSTIISQGGGTGSFDLAFLLLLVLAKLGFVGRRAKLI
jgi:primary-amine oxidase